MSDLDRLLILSHAGVDPDLAEMVYLEDGGRTAVVRYRSYLGLGDSYVALTDRRPTPPVETTTEANRVWRTVEPAGGTR